MVQDRDAQKLTSVTETVCKFDILGTGCVTARGMIMNGYQRYRITLYRGAEDFARVDYRPIGESPRDELHGKDLVSAIE
jgi:hypothetical protein